MSEIKFDDVTMNILINNVTDNNRSLLYRIKNWISYIFIVTYYIGYLAFF